MDESFDFFNGWMGDWSLPYTCGTPRRPEEGIGSPGSSWSYSDCEMPSRDIGNQTLFLWKSGKYVKTSPSHQGVTQAGSQLLLSLLPPLQHILLVTDATISSVKNFQLEPVTRSELPHSGMYRRGYPFFH